MICLYSNIKIPGRLVSRFQKGEKNGFNLKGKGEKMIQKEKFRSKMTSKEKKPADGIDYASRKITGKHRDTNRQSRNQKDYFSHRGHRGGYAPRTRNPKGHRNSLCDIGIISCNENKKLKDCITELKKSSLCELCALCGNKYSARNGKILRLSNQIPGFFIEIQTHDNRRGVDGIVL
jgi:hypothetical protein